MGTIPSYDAATTPLQDSDQFYIEQGVSADRGKRATVLMLNDKIAAGITPLITAEAVRAQAAEQRLSERDYKLALYYFIQSNITDPQPLGQITGPAATITQANTAPVDIALMDNTNIDWLRAWYETSTYRNPSVAIDPIIMTAGAVGMKTLAASLPVGTASAYAADSKFMAYWSQSLDRIVVATSGAYHNNAFGKIGLLLPEGNYGVPEAQSDELIVRFTRALTANVLDSFTVSVHRPAFIGNSSVVLPLSSITGFDTGSTVAIRARRSAGAYDWKIDIWEEP